MDVTAERLSHVDPAHVAETEIEHDDIGPMDGSQGNGLFAAARFGHNRQIGFVTDETGKAAPYDEVIIDEHDG